MPGVDRKHVGPSVMLPESMLICPCCGPALWNRFKQVLEWRGDRDASLFSRVMLVTRLVHSTDGAIISASGL